MRLFSKWFSQPPPTGYGAVYGERQPESSKEAFFLPANTSPEIRPKKFLTPDRVTLIKKVGCGILLTIAAIALFKLVLLVVAVAVVVFTGIAIAGAIVGSMNRRALTRQERDFFSSAT